MMQFDPATQTWEEFIRASARRAAAQMDEAGRREAREIFAASRQQAALLQRQWEALLPGMDAGMDRDKIAAAVHEFRHLLTDGQPA